MLEGGRIPYMVIGGLANLVWGEPRTTLDIDVTVDIEDVGTRAFATLVREVGDPLPDDPVAFAERTRVLPVRTPEGVGVDFVLATLPFEIAAIGRARTVRIADTDVRVCTPEDLIVHKIVSERPRDHEDIVGVLKRQREVLDLAWLDSTVDALAAGLGEPAVAERYRLAKGAAGVG